MNIAKLWRLAGIKSDEHRLARMCIIYAMFVGLAQVWLKVIPVSIFLQHYATTTLPYVYLASSVLLILVGVVYDVMARHLVLSKLLKIFSIVLAIVFLLIWGGLVINIGDWIYFLALLGAQASYNIFQLQVWGMLNHLFTLDQAKRMLGTIGAFQTSTYILGNLSIPLFIYILGINNLILCVSLIIFVSTVVLFIILRKYNVRFDQLLINIKEKKEGISKIKWFQNSYFKNIAIFVVLNIFIFVIIDVLFYSEVKRVIKNEIEIANFLGIFFAILYTLDLINLGVVSNLIINKLGIKAGLLSRFYINGFMILLLLSVLPFHHLYVIFFLLSVMKLFEESMANSVWRQSYLLLYQPLAPKIRSWFLGKIEFYVIPLSTILASLTIITIWHFVNIQLSYALFVLLGAVIVMIIIGSFLQKGYIEQLDKTIAKQTLSISQKQFDKGYAELLLMKIAKGTPQQAAYCLDLLEKMDKTLFEKGLNSCLNSSDILIRRQGVIKLQSFKIPSLIPLLEQAIQQESEPFFRSGAYKALLFQYEVAEEELKGFFNEGDQLLLEEIIQLALKNQHGISLDRAIEMGLKYNILVNEAIYELNRLAHSQSKEDRLRAAYILGTCEGHKESLINLAKPLVEKLLVDEDPRIISAMIEGVPVFQDANLYKILMEYLDNVTFRSQVVPALVKGKKSTLPLLEIALEKSMKNGDKKKSQSIIMVLGYFKNEAIEILLRYLQVVEESTLRYHILESLDNAGYHTVSLANVDPVLHYELGHMQLLINFLEQLQNHSGYELLYDALKRELFFSQKQIFLLLGFIYPKERIRNIYFYLKNVTDADKSSYANELLENILHKEHRAHALPLIRQSYSLQFASQFTTDGLNILEKILSLPTDKITNLVKTMALYTIYQLRIQKFTPIIEKLKFDEDFMIRETAQWILNKKIDSLQSTVQKFGY